MEQTGRDRPTDDVLVRIILGLASLAVLWFAVRLVHPIGPTWLLWFTMPFYGPILSVIFWQVSRTPTMLAAGRQLWRRLSPVPFLVGCGQTAQAVDILLNPDVRGDRNGPVMLAFDTAALLLVVHALTTLPTSRRDRDGALRIMLDASTMMLATAVFIWHFGLRQQVGGLSASTIPGQNAAVAVAISLALMLLASFGIFAMARVMLSEHRMLDGKGLRLLAVAISFATLTPLLQPAVAAVDPRLFVYQFSIPLTFAFGALAGAHQRHAAPAVRRAGRRPLRTFSLLPYTAVAAVDALLLWEACTHGDDLIVISAAAVALTAIVVSRQIKALRENGRMVVQLDHNATHDSLTGLANRVLFQRRLHEALNPLTQRAIRDDGDTLSVMLIDLDGFKEVNDTLGHEIGDQLLARFAERLDYCTRTGDTVARLGGDEFVMLVSEGGKVAAASVAQDVIDALREPVLIDGHLLPVRASIGIADGHPGEEPATVLRRADLAMYAAKAGEGSSFAHWHEEIAAPDGEQARLAGQLREAIAADQLFLLYQPIVNLRDGRLLGAEALIRWAHPTRGTLAPDMFIPLAERSGLMVDLGRWVLRTAVRQLAEWPGERDAVPENLNINLSALELREPDLVTEVGEILGEFGIAPGRVTFEITETVALQDGQSVITLHALRALGVRVSLDDFGTGYSTLSLLHRCPVDEIKLDRSFTQAQADGRVPMSAAVIHLAQLLGLHAVAEGVETVDQAQHLLDLGYVAAQGYHFARPVSPDRFTELLAGLDAERQATSATP